MKWRAIGLRIVVAVLGGMTGALLWSAEPPATDLPTGAMVRLGTIDPRQQKAKETGKAGPEESRVSAVAFSRDGKTVVTRRLDGTMALWEIPSGKMLRQLSYRLPDGSTVWSPIAFSADDKTIVAVEAGLVRRWDVTTGELKGSFGDKQRIEHAVAFSTDGRQVAVEKPDGSFVTYDLEREKELHKFVAKRPAPRDGFRELSTCPARLAFSADGRLLAGETDDRRLHIMDGTTGGFVGALEGCECPVQSIAFSPTAPLIATAEGASDRRGNGSRDIIRLWSLTTRKQVLEIRGHTDRIFGLAFSPDGRLLASAAGGGEDDTIRLWEVATGKEILQWRDQGSGTLALAFSPDGRLLATAQTDGTAVVWNLRPRDWVQKLPTAKDLADQWESLASDANRAYRSIALLEVAPKEATALLKARLRVVPTEKAEVIRRLVLALDDADYEARETASRELARLGPQTAEYLRKEVERPRSTESRQRAETVIKKFEAWPPPDANTLRDLRAIGVLEQIGSVDAKEILSALADGEASSPVTQSAKDALARLNRPRSK